MNAPFRREARPEALLALLLLSVIKGEGEVNISRRRLSGDTVRRALAVAALYLSVLLMGTLAISLIEDSRFALADVLFECSSAMGTVGVSAIGTPNLSAASRALLMPMMFLGRVGPLTLAVAVARRLINVLYERQLVGESEKSVWFRFVLWNESA